MKRRRHTPEQVIRKLAEGDKLLGQGQTIEEVVRHLEITESTWHSELYAIAARIDEHLVRWAMQKFKRLRGRPNRAWRWLDAARLRQPTLFAHWHLLASPTRRTVGAV